MRKMRADSFATLGQKLAGTIDHVRLAHQMRSLGELRTEHAPIRLQENPEIARRVGELHLVAVPTVREHALERKGLHGPEVQQGVLECRKQLTRGLGKLGGHLVIGWTTARKSGDQMA
jgi:hypothetical protein